MCHPMSNQLRERLSREEPSYATIFDVISISPKEGAKQQKKSSKERKGDWESLSKVINPTSTEMFSPISQRAFLFLSKSKLTFQRFLNVDDATHILSALLLKFYCCVKRKSSLDRNLEHSLVSSLVSRFRGLGIDKVEREWFCLSRFV